MGVSGPAPRGRQRPWILRFIEKSSKLRATFQNPNQVAFALRFLDGCHCEKSWTISGRKTNRSIDRLGMEQNRHQEKRCFALHLEENIAAEEAIRLPKPPHRHGVTGSGKMRGRRSQGPLADDSRRSIVSRQRGHFERILRAITAGTRADRSDPCCARYFLTANVPGTLGLSSRRNYQR